MSHEPSPSKNFKSHKNLKNAKVLCSSLQKAINSFLVKDLTISEIIKENEKSDLDKPFLTQAKTEKSFMKSAALPSSKYWGVIEQNEDNITQENSKELKGLKEGILSKMVKKPFKDVTWAKPFSLLSYINEKECCDKKQFVKLGHYIFSINTPILGLNQHISNKNIFFMVSPVNGYEHKILPKENRTESEYLEERKQLGQQYLTDVINTVNEIHPKTQITCIVLGDRNLSENMEVYSKARLLGIQNDEKQKIMQYHFSKTDSKANIDVNICNIDAHGHKISLTSKDLETIYKVGIDLQKGNGKGQAIIVHCQQGMDRTGMLIFAFVLFEKYDYFFSEKNSVLRIYTAYIDLQLSRSPFALTKKADFINAIYLAHVLKSIDLEEDCFAHFDNFLIQDKFLNQRRTTLMKRLVLANSNKEKLSWLKIELKHITARQNKNSYLAHETPKKGRTAACNASLPPLFLSELKRSPSNPESLCMNRHRFDTFSTHNGQSLNLEINAAPNEITKPALSSISRLRRSSSDPGNLCINKIKPEPFEIKIKNNPGINEPMINPSSFFSKKACKTESKDIKGSNGSNLPKKYVKELTIFINIIQHRIDTEDALQNLIKPIEENSSQFVIK